MPEWKIMIVNEGTSPHFTLFIRKKRLPSGRKGEKTDVRRVKRKER